MGGSTAITLQFFDSFSNLLSIAPRHSSASQEAAIRQGTAEVMILVDQFYSAFPGLEDFQTSVTLRSNPENARFYELYEGFQMNVLHIFADPAYALPYLTNSNTISQIVEITVLCAKASQLSQTGELSFYFRIFTNIFYHVSNIAIYNYYKSVCQFCCKWHTVQYAELLYVHSGKPRYY